MNIPTLEDKSTNSANMMVFQVCFLVTLISNLFIYIAQPLHIVLLETLASRCFMLSNLVALFFVFNHCLKRYIPYKTEQIVIIFFMIGFSFLSFLMSSSGGLYSYVIRIVCYLSLPIYFIYMDYLSPSKALLNFIFIINFMITMVFALLSISKYKYAGYENFLGTDGAWLTLGYYNPNQTAMYLVIAIIVLLCAMYFYTNILIKFLIILDITYMTWLLIDTSSRTSIAIGALIFIIAIFTKRYRMNKLIIITFLMIPLLFLILYPYLFDKGWIYVMEFRGKLDYSSRSYIFRSILSSVKDRFLFGDFGRYELQNLHNGILSVYSSLGLAGLLLFYTFYGRAFFHIFENGIRSKIAYIAVMGLLSIFLHACTESAYIVGGSMYAGSLSIFILLVKLHEKEVKQN